MGKRKNNHGVRNNKNCVQRSLLHFWKKKQRNNPQNEHVSAKNKTTPERSKTKGTSYQSERVESPFPCDLSTACNSVLACKLKKDEEHETSPTRAVSPENKNDEPVRKSENSNEGDSQSSKDKTATENIVEEQDESTAMRSNSCMNRTSVTPQLPAADPSRTAYNEGTTHSFNNDETSSSLTSTTDKHDSAGSSSSSSGSDSSDNDSLQDESAHDKIMSGLSEYELLRLENIKRNNARLEALGLLNITNTHDRSKRKGKNQRARVRKQDRPPSIPTRRSTRTIRGQKQWGEVTQSLKNDESHDQGFSCEIEDVSEDQQEQFEVSPVVQYVMDDENGGSSNSSCAAATVGGNVTSLSLGTCRLYPPQGLGAVYTMQFYPYCVYADGCVENDDNNNSTHLWLVGGGKSGIVALWDCNKKPHYVDHDENSSSDDSSPAGGIDPILSWKAHGGRWISSAHFLPKTATSNCHTRASPSRLVTAANDGCVCLWDLTTVSASTGLPKLTCRTGKELHGSGIFAMDVSVQPQSETLIGTGSKDKTVVVSFLDSMEHGSGECFLWKSTFHSAKVSAVQFQKDTTTTLLASASDDGLVAIHDYKSKGGTNCQTVAVLEAHDRPHSVVWDPCQQHVLLTAGLDHEMKIWDIRNSSQPLCGYYGHVPINTRCQKIHHPIFYNPGREMTQSRFILSGGQGSNSLSMFHHNINNSWRQPNNPNLRHAVYSRGKIPSGCGDAGCIAVHNDRVAASVDGGEILLLSPCYQ